MIKPTQAMKVTIKSSILKLLYSLPETKSSVADHDLSKSPDNAVPPGYRST